MWLLLDQCVFAEDYCADLIAGEIGVEDIHGHGCQISTGLGLFDGLCRTDHSLRLGIVSTKVNSRKAVFGAEDIKKECRELKTLAALCVKGEAR